MSTIQNERRVVYTVITALLIDLLAFTIILPLFPRLLNYYRQEEADNKVTVDTCPDIDTIKTPVLTHTLSLFLLKAYFTWLCSRYPRKIQTMDRRVKRKAPAKMGHGLARWIDRLTILHAPILRITDDWTGE